MSTTLTITHAHSEWQTFFSTEDAIRGVLAHVAALPSSRTEEKHTLQVYKSGLYYFLNWYADQLPTPTLIKGFIAHLVGRGLKSNTISSKYLAPVRLFMTQLLDQAIDLTSVEVRQYVSDCKAHIQSALRVKSPRAEQVTNIAPLWRFNHLSLTEVNSTLRQIDRTTLLGKRDYALLHIAFSTGLRLAELARVTLANITPYGDMYLITVRGKRSNIDPVPMTATAYAHLLDYLNAFNARLRDEYPDPLAASIDPRYIHHTTPLWQPLHKGGGLIAVGTNNYSPARGMSHQALRNVIANRTQTAIGRAIAPHDTRRTAAAIAYDSGMNLPDIQALLRHKDAAVTLRYIGQKPDHANRALGLRVAFG